MFLDNGLAVRTKGCGDRAPMPPRNESLGDSRKQRATKAPPEEALLAGAPRRFPAQSARLDSAEGEPAHHLAASDSRTRDRWLRNRSSPTIASNAKRDLRGSMRVLRQLRSDVVELSREPLWSRKRHLGDQQVDRRKPPDGSVHRLFKHVVRSGSHSCNHRGTRHDFPSGHQCDERNLRTILDILFKVRRHRRKQEEVVVALQPCLGRRRSLQSGQGDVEAIHCKDVGF